MSGPFDMGNGRNGPRSSAHDWKPGQGQVRKAAPYRPDVSDVDFVAVGDVIVCVLAPSRDKVELGDVALHAPEQESHFHVVVSVGEKVGEKIGVDLDAGDIVFFAGGNRIETLAGSVWFVRAEHVLSVILPRSKPEPEVATDPQDHPALSGA